MLRPPTFSLAILLSRRTRNWHRRRASQLTDPNLSDSHSYEIVGGHPLFAIDADSITLKAGAQLD